MSAHVHEALEWALVLPHRRPADGVVRQLAAWTTPVVVADVIADGARGLVDQLDGLPTDRDWVGECGGVTGAVLVLAEVESRG